MPDVRFGSGVERNEHGQLMGLQVRTVRTRTIVSKCDDGGVAGHMIGFTLEEAKMLRSFLDAAIAHVEKLNRKPKARGTA